MNIRILLGIFIIVLITKLNGRFLLVNVGDPAIDDANRHRIEDPDVDDANNRPEMGKIEIEPKCPDCCPFCFLEACMNPRICPETKRPKETLGKSKLNQSVQIAVPFVSLKRV